MVDIDPLELVSGIYSCFAFFALTVRKLRQTAFQALHL